MKEEREALDRRRKERDEQHLYLTVGVVTEQNFKSHQGFDLTKWDADDESESAPTTHRVLKTSTLTEFVQSLAESQQIPPEKLRLWAMVNRQNKTIRPDQPLLEPEMTIEAAYVKYGSRDKSFRLWVEEAMVFENGKPVWPEPQSQNNSNSSILVFLKYFDADAQSLAGVGHIYLKKQSKVSDMVPMILQLMGWTNGAPTNVANGLTNGAPSPPTLALYEEIKHSMIEPMKPKSTLHQAEIQDGDIVCFQKALSEKQASVILQAGGYTDTREFYDHLLNRKSVTFSPKVVSDTDKDVFKLDLGRKMSYEQFSAKVGEHLKIDPTHLRFSTVNSTTGKIKNIVKRTANQNLYQILSPQYGTYGTNNQRDDALYYEVLDMSLSELDTKKSMKVTWLTEGVSKEVSYPTMSSLPHMLTLVVQELLDILVPKTGTIHDLLVGLQKKANLDDETMQNVRIYEAHGGKVHKELHEENQVSLISEFVALYAEVIPEEERNANAEEGDSAIYCFHFDKEPNKPHSVPFKFIVKPVSRWSGTVCLGVILTTLGRTLRRH